MIRKALEADFDQIWTIFHPIVNKGDTYGFAINTSKQQAFDLWITAMQETYVYEENNKILGSYYLKQNFAGPGSHVCNCGYMVSDLARGKGLATKMCVHSQARALELGYKAMQFNYVASSNKGAIRLWQKLGYEIVGNLPKAFDHPQLGFIDALVMFKTLS